MGISTAVLIVILLIVIVAVIAIHTAQRKTTSKHRSINQHTPILDSHELHSSDDEE